MSKALQHRAAGPVAWLLSLVVVLTGLLGLAGELRDKAIYNWDLMGYVGCLVELDLDDPATDDAAEIHERVLEVVETEVPAPIRPRLLADPRFRSHPDYEYGRQVATDPEAFAAQLDWYRSRVGFTALLAAVHHGTGRPPLASLRLLIDASYVALGLLLWAWLGRALARSLPRSLGPWPGPFAGAALALGVAASVPVAGVARLHTADLTATVPLLAGLWALTVSRSAWPALGLFLAAVLLRPDHAVTCVVVLLVAALASTHRPVLAPRTPRAHLLAATGVLAAVYVAIGQLTHHPGWTRLFSFTFVHRRVDLSDARFDLGEYLAAFPGTSWDLGSTSTPLFAALAVCLCVLLPARTRDEQALRLLTRALTAAFALRFLAFPVIWDRFWLPLDLWVLGVLVLTLAPSEVRATQP